jgi:hypothetical protein
VIGDDELLDAESELIDLAASLSGYGVVWLSRYGVVWLSRYGGRCSGPAAYRSDRSGHPGGDHGDLDWSHDAPRQLRGGTVAPAAASAERARK